MKNLPLIRQIRTTLLVACVSITGADAAEQTFSRFRFTPVELRDDAGADSVQLSEFELKLGAANINLGTATITNPGGDNPAGEEVAFIADQDTGSKWLDFERGPVIFQFAAPVTIDRYRFATAGDEPGRDPLKWKFDGSNDGITWTLLDQRNSYPVPTNRNTFTGDIFLPALNKGGLIFDFGVTRSFDSYRLTTAGDAIERDPVRWILEGSADAVTWTLIENFTAWDYPVPETRNTATGPIPLPDPSLHPLAPLGITASTIDRANQRLALTFRSIPGKLYRVMGSANLSQWAVLQNNIAGAAVSEETRVIEIPYIPYIPDTRIFFRVEEQ